MQNFLARFFNAQTDNPQRTAPVPPPYEPLFYQAQAAQQRQDWEAARSAYEAGVSMARQNSDWRTQQFFLTALGMVFYRTRAYGMAEKTLLEALELALRLDDPLLIARSRINMGEVYATQGQWEAAKPYQEQALEMARLAKDTPTLLIAQENLARNYIEQKNATYAIHLLREALNLAQESKNAHVGASLVAALGLAHLSKGEREQGRKFLAQWQALALQTGREGLALQCLVNLARADLEDKQDRSAIERFQAAEDFARKLGGQPKSFYRDVALSLSIAYRHMGNFAEAQAQAERALLHSQELKDLRTLQQANIALGLAWQGMGKHEAAVQKLETALAFYETEGGNDYGPMDKLNFLLALGKSQLKLRQAATAEASFNQALLLAQEARQPLREAEALHLLGSAKAALQESAAAMDLWRGAARIYEGQAKAAEAARVLCDLGNLRRLHGDLSAATKDFETALTYLSSINDQVTRGLVLSNAANLYTQTGDMQTAEDFYQQAIAIAHDLNDPHSESVRKGNLAWYYVLTGQTSKALALFEDALAISQKLNDPLLVAIQTNNLGYAQARTHKHDLAIQYYEQALALLERTEAERWQAIVKSNMGSSYVESGRYEQAGPLYETALEISGRLNDRENLIRTQARMGTLHRHQGQLEPARQFAQKAYEEARRMSYRKGQADAARVLGDIYQQEGQAETAQPYYAEAHKLYKLIKDPLAEKYAAYL